MNEAEAILGPKKHVEMPTAQQTHFGRYPAVQDLCDTFWEFMGWGTDAYTIQQIVAGAKDFNLAIGNKPDLLLRALKKMKKNKMSIGSPRSCITFAREMLRSLDPDSEENRRRYLKGWDDETERADICKSRENEEKRT